jgi:hypothetical protein
VLHVSGVGDPASIVVGVIEGSGVEMTGTLVGVRALLAAGEEEPIEFVAVT